MLPEKYAMYRYAEIISMPKTFVQYRLVSIYRNHLAYLRVGIETGRSSAPPTAQGLQL
jgi:hypothetical protein